MPRILRDLKITEVSSVDKGAGRGVKVMLMKRDDESADDVIDVRGLITKKTKETADMTPEQIAEMINKAVTAAVSPLQADITKRDSEIAFLKMTDEEKAFCADMGDEEKKSFADMKPEERAAKMKKSDDPDAALDAKITKAVQPIVTENAELRKQLQAYETERTIETFKKRAVDAGLKAEDGEIMRKAYSGDADAGDKLAKRIAEITASAAAMAKAAGVFSEFGSNHQASGDTPLAKLNALASDLRKADPKLSQAQAFAKVATDPANIELWQEARKLEKSAANLSI